MNRCLRCGRYGDWRGGVCDTCLQTEALEEKNKIEKERLKREEEQRKRDEERNEREQRIREEQLRQDERNQRLREEQLEQERIRDERNQRLREEQLRFEQERSEQEREDRLREIEAQEEANQIQREKYENEKKEKEEKAWTERTNYLDSLPDAEIKKFFEINADEKERDYLKQRYRKCISSEEYLEFIKNEDKFLKKKQIRNFVKTHSTDESLAYIFSMDTYWYAQIIEQENFLKEFPELNIEIAPEVEEIFKKASNAKKRQKILRLNAYVDQFKKMSSVDKQIYFREYIQKKCKELFPEINFSNDKEFIMFWKLNPSLRTSKDSLSEDITESYELFSLLEPLYIESLNENERKKYLAKKKQTEKTLAENKRKIEEQKAIYQKQIEEYRQEFDEKRKENEKLIAECNEINKRREKRALIYERRKKSKKNTPRLGCAAIFVLLLICGIFGTKYEIILSSACLILLLFILIPIKFFILSMKIRKNEKEEQEDVAEQNTIVKKSQQLVIRLNELQRLLLK